MDLDRMARLEIEALLQSQAETEPQELEVLVRERREAERQGRLHCCLRTRRRPQGCGSINEDEMPGALVIQINTTFTVVPSHHPNETGGK
jgi:hypothetical protein